jgi:serine/threonine protein phosphatase PrpC
VRRGAAQEASRDAESRSFGDHQFKQFVTADPHIVHHDISDDDEFMIFACDGVWDVIK